MTVSHAAEHGTRRDLLRRRLAAAPRTTGPGGSPRVEEVITDNDLSYKRSHDVHDAITALRARHLFIKAHCPWQNGKVVNG